MASAELSRRVEKVVGYPPLCHMAELHDTRGGGLRFFVQRSSRPVAGLGVAVQKRKPLGWAGSLPPGDSS